MITKQSTGAHIIRFLSILFMVLGLAACSSTPEPKPEPKPAPAPVAEPAPEPAPPPVIKPDRPDNYTVVKGDTLWDIASRFLNDPWLWPELWHINTQIRNPHLIYPGDVIVLYYVDGKPYLTLDGAASAVPKYGKPDVKSFKLSPKIRSESLEKAITTIPRELIAPFLSRPRVATDDEIDAAPHIVASYERHLLTGTGNKVYAKGFKDKLFGSYHVVRPGIEYEDPETGETLGYELIDLANANVQKTGDPVTMIISEARQEVINGDLLFPHEEKKLDFRFLPRPPSDKIDGSIIHVINGLSLIGQYNIVVINRGKKHGLEPGHVLAVLQKGEEVDDPNSFFGSVKLPDERAGIMMIFSVKEKLSFGLVMEAQKTIRKLDKVTNP
jgi:hypothetical protein